MSSVVPDELTVNPGTGGDIAPRRPSTGGEFIDENDVEGHVVTEFLPGTGTGGDFAPSRRPSTGGEFIDENDVEGHVRLALRSPAHRHPAVSSGGVFRCLGRRQASSAVAARIVLTSNGLAPGCAARIRAA